MDSIILILFKNIRQKLNELNIANDDDVLTFLSDKKYVVPIASGDGTIFTDNDNTIYTL